MQVGPGRRADDSDSDPGSEWLGAVMQRGSAHSYCRVTETSRCRTSSAQCPPAAKQLQRGVQCLHCQTDMTMALSDLIGTTRWWWWQWGHSDKELCNVKHFSTVNLPQRSSGQGPGFPRVTDSGRLRSVAGGPSGVECLSANQPLSAWSPAQPHDRRLQQLWSWCSPEVPLAAHRQISAPGAVRQRKGQ